MLGKNVRKNALTNSQIHIKFTFQLSSLATITFSATSSNGLIPNQCRAALFRARNFWPLANVSIILPLRPPSSVSTALIYSALASSHRRRRLVARSTSLYCGEDPPSVPCTHTCCALVASHRNVCSMVMIGTSL